MSGIQQGVQLDDNWRVLGDYKIEMVLGKTGERSLSGSTRCVKVQALAPPGTKFGLIHCAVSIQRESTSQIMHAVFFRGTPFNIQRLRDDGSIKIPNMADAESSSLAIGWGGEVTLNVIEQDVEDTPDVRREICLSCPSNLFTGVACDALRCCKEKTPDPKRWENAIQIGACPRGHFSSKTHFKVLTPIRPGAMIIGSNKIPTL